MQTIAAAHVLTHRLELRANASVHSPTPRVSPSPLIRLPLSSSFGSQTKVHLTADMPIRWTSTRAETRQPNKPVKYGSGGRLPRERLLGTLILTWQFGTADSAKYRKN